MKKFIVKIPEIHFTEIELFAESQENALDKAQIIYIQGDDLVSLFDHTKDPNEWEITEIQEVKLIEKKEEIIQDAVDTCINDPSYLYYIVSEHFNNMSSDEIDRLYEELELAQKLNQE